MNRKLKKVLGEDDQPRGESRYTRLLLEDDKVVASRLTSGRSGTPSAIISDLVHKGLAYEALQQGADDPVIRGLLRTLDQIVQHRIAPLSESLAQTQAELASLKLFLAALFVTFTAKLDFPLESADSSALDIIHDGCAGPANEMLTLVMAHADDSPAQSPPPDGNAAGAPSSRSA